MNVLDLFSGIGGFSLGLERAGFKTIAFCEIDPFCQRVLKKHWPDVPIYEDIRTLKGDEIGPVDLVCGGFPCQPWSVAGKRRGTEDDRDLWPEMRRIIGSVKPEWVVGENVPGLDDEQFMGLDRVLSDLEGLGYQATTFEIPACAVNAPHRRARLWIVAHRSEGRCNASRTGPGTQNDDRQTNWPKRCGPHVAHSKHSARRRGEERRPRGDGRPELHGADVAHDAVGQRGNLGGEATRARPERAPGGCGGNVGDAYGAGLEIRQGLTADNGSQRQTAERASHWSDAEWLNGRRVKPGVRLLADGVPNRVAQLRALGNAAVPQVVEQIGRAIIGAEAK